MFDTPDTQRKSNGPAIMLGIAIVVVAVCVGAFMYVNSKGNSKSAVPSSSTAMTAAPAAGADPVHDLRVVSVKMDKDYTGTTAVWSVDLKNQSQAFTYSNVNYETTYIGADNTVLLQNHGTMSVTLEPGEEQSTQFRDALYPSGTAVYRVRIVSAVSTK
jgi:hypothetical protein